ncbi:hypothetical protein MHS07_19115 [Pseudomonas aeruginosa]|uniref:zinc ribbon domain-containing protein n=1 Tax=Pseudomonas aeruginosa TaxID=287 RepID=UPI001F052C15|nr:zinc ribbon domain-containing protein [Pseudomonas aeruginosa]MCH1121259.1 hypothetical protein [Pseudomonas aeruginosa]
MSSTQHQLIEQCATRLRGIVEALDNIHDSTQHRSPHRWSTDLDEVHSSAESLLAMIKDQAPPSEDQLIAAGLSYPLAKEDAVQLWYAGFRSEVVTVLEAWEAIGHDIGMNPSKGELLDSLRNMAAICNAHGNDMPAQSAIDQRQVIADAITGALAFGAQASQPPAEDHWLRPFYDIGRAEGQRTQELAMLVRMLAASLKRHAPESNLVARATNYLAAKGLAGTPLRDPPAPVEQAGGDERAAFEAWATHLPMDRQPLRPDLYMPQTQWAWEAWQFRAALAQPSQSQYEASFEEWLANELEGEDGQPVPAAVCDITLARRAFNHWPKLEQPAKVGGVRFSAGVSSRLVVEAAQRLNEFESTPEKEAERIERLQAFREQLDPLNLAPHAEAFNEAPDEALRPEQAEAERPEGPTEDELEAAGLGYPLHKEEAVKLWYSGFRSEVITVLEAWEAIGHDIGMNPDKGELLDSLRYMLEKCEAHDAALARVAELERQQPVAWMHDQPNRVDVIHRDVKDLLQRVPGSSRGIYRPLDVSEHYTIPLYAAPVAQAQHSVPEISGIGRDAEHPRAVVLYLRNEPSEEDMRAIQNFLRAISADVLTQAQHSAGYAEARMCANCRHIGINDAADYAACHDCNWTGPEPDEDKCPGCAGENCMAAACPECGCRYDLVAEANITAPAGQVPQAWLDVQAERRRQITAEGWTPEHDDEHADGQMARAAACYALAGSSAPNDGTAALLVSLAWPWDEQWWKPTTVRRDMVKACALALAEIERLDRTAPVQGSTCCKGDA